MGVTAAERAAGYGKPGFCKLCVSPYAAALNKQIEKGLNAAECQRWAKELDEKFTFNRATFYTHRDEHITHPLIPAAEQARRNPVIVPRTNVGVLEAIRDIGRQRASEHPEEVTVDHALKAATALEQRKGGTDNIIILLAKAMQGAPMPVEAQIVEGEYREVPDGGE
jgi:hypothetical protein